MRRNVEVKLRVEDPQALAARVREAGGEDRGVLEQKDTYFRVPSGSRLKVRLQKPGRDELIAYLRPDVADSRTSRYLVCSMDAGGEVLLALSLALGVERVVEKRRHLFLLGRTRVHFDDVKGLGSFLELEVVLGETEDEESGRKEAEGILRRLGLAGAPRIAGSYANLQGEPE